MLVILQQYLHINPHPANVENKVRS